MTKGSLSHGTVMIDIAANLLGKGWQAGLNVLLVPVYVRLLGIEAYGLVGFYSTLLATFGLLDLGLTTTLNREIARCGTTHAGCDSSRDVVKTLQAVYWGNAIIVFLGIAYLSPVIARDWLRSRALPITVIEQSVTMMGALVAFQLMLGFYSGGLLGMRRQTTFNALNCGLATLRGGGAVLVLLLYFTHVPRIVTFFSWQAIATLLGLLTMAATVWHLLPSTGQKARFRPAILLNTWRFAVGMGVTSVAGLIAGYSDKILISKFMSLEMLGYYTLAATIGTSLNFLGTPVYTAVFPAFTQLAAHKDERALQLLYHQATQVVALLVLPVAAVVTFFARDIILLWTGSPLTATKTDLAASLLTAGTAFALLASVPYAVQLAHGWTSLGLVSNIAGACVVTPVLVVAIRQYGIPGAAATWLLLNLGYVFVTTYVMHGRILKGQWPRWCVRDVLLPLIAVCAPVALMRTLAPRLDQGWPQTVSWLVLAYLSALALGVAVCPQARTMLRRVRKPISPLEGSCDGHTQLAVGSPEC